MAEPLNYKVNLDAKQAQRDTDALKKSQQQLGEELEDTRTEAQRMADLIVAASREIEQAIKDDEAAAAALKVELDKLGSAVSADEGVAKLKQLGLTCNQIEGDAKELAAALKQAGDTEVIGAQHAAKQGIDDLGASASSSKSVLANMVGNSAQDLGNLGGIAGSAGVAFGQMGEYIADALGSGDKLGNTLKNFGMVAGPIAAVAVGVQLVSMWMGQAEKSRAFHRERVDEFTDAIREADSAMEGFAQHFRDKMAVEIVNADGEIRDATLSLALMGENMKTFEEKALQGEAGVKKFVEETVKAHPALKEMGEKALDAQFSTQYLNSALESGDPLVRAFAESVVALRQANEDYSAAGGQATAHAVFFGEAAKNTTTQVRYFNDEAKIYQEMAKGMSKATDKATDSSKAMATAAADQQRAIENLYSSMRSMVDAEYAFEDSVEQAKDQVAAMNETLADSESTYREQDEAIDAARDAAIEASKAYVEMEGANLNSEEGIRLQINALKMQQAELEPGSPLWLAIQGYIDKLNEIPANINTRIASTIVGTTGPVVGAKDPSGSTIIYDKNVDPEETGNSLRRAGQSSGRPLVVVANTYVDGELVAQSQDRYRRGAI